MVHVLALKAVAMATAAIAGAVTGVTHADHLAHLEHEQHVAGMSSSSSSSTGVVRVYIVRQGDTLANISAEFCGTTGSADALAAASGIGNPNVIYPGQRVVLTCSGGQSSSSSSSGSSSSGSASINTTGSIAAAGQANIPGTVPAIYSYGGLEQLWVSVGGPVWAAAQAASIAECESGGKVYAHNPSGASGLWQILGQVVGGYIYDPVVNAENAVAKFSKSHDTFAQWVCK